MENRKITPDRTVEEILVRWPETIPVFLGYKMSCVGCSMNAFERIEDAAHIYRLPLTQFLRDLNQAIEPVGRS